MSKYIHFISTLIKPGSVLQLPKKHLQAAENPGETPKTI